MGVKCQIFIQIPKSGAFRPGQPVVGTVKYFIDKPTKFKTIDLSFLGKGTLKWTEAGPNNGSYEYYNEEEYINDKINLFKANKGHEVLLSGSFEYPFDFLLPDDIPSSIKNWTGGKIEYKVIVRFEKSTSLSMIQVCEQEIRVYGYVSPCSPEPWKFGLQKNLFSLTSNNNIDIKAEIERTCLAPGENIKLDFSIHNETDVPFTIEMELIEYFTRIGKKNKTSVVSMPLKNPTYSTTIMEKSLTLITCLVPTLPTLYSIQHSKILIGEYHVRVTAKLPFPYNNADVDVPIIIGERRDRVEAACLNTPEIDVENLIDL